MSGLASMGGGVNVGYAYHGAAQPIACDKAKIASAAPDAPASNQSLRCMRRGLTDVRWPDPKPRASIDSAS